MQLPASHLGEFRRAFVWGILSSLFCETDLVVFYHETTEHKTKDRNTPNLYWDYFKYTVSLQFFLRFIHLHVQLVA